MYIVEMSNLQQAFPSILDTILQRTEAYCILKLVEHRKVVFNN